MALSLPYYYGHSGEQLSLIHISIWHSQTRTLHSPRKRSRASIARKNVSLVNSSAMLSLPDSESRYRYTSSKYTAYTSSNFVSALTPFLSIGRRKTGFLTKKSVPRDGFFLSRFDDLFLAALRARELDLADVFRHAAVREMCIRDRSYPYVTFDYVTFSLPTTAQGTLYYGGTAMSTRCV